jgi:hypothetical protein
MTGHTQAMTDLEETIRKRQPGTCILILSDNEIVNQELGVSQAEHEEGSWG